MASKTCQYCSQVDFPEYLGTDVDVNPHLLVIWEEFAGPLKTPFVAALPRPPALPSETVPPRETGHYMAARTGPPLDIRHPEATSAGPPLRRYQTTCYLVHPNQIGRAYVGYPTGSPLFAPLWSRVQPIPARCLRPIGCELVGWYVSGSHQISLVRSVLLSWVWPIPESGTSEKFSPNHRGRTCLSRSPTPDRMTGVESTSGKKFLDPRNIVPVKFAIPSEVYWSTVQKSLSVSPEYNPGHGHQLQWIWGLDQQDNSKMF